MCVCVLVCVFVYLCSSVCVGDAAYFVNELASVHGGGDGGCSKQSSGTYTLFTTYTTSTSSPASCSQEELRTVTLGRTRADKEGVRLKAQVTGLMRDEAVLRERLAAQDRAMQDHVQQHQADTEELGRLGAALERRKGEKDRADSLAQQAAVLAAQVDDHVAAKEAAVAREVAATAKRGALEARLAEATTREEAAGVKLAATRAELRDLETRYRNDVAERVRHRIPPPPPTHINTPPHTVPRLLVATNLPSHTRTHLRARTRISSQGRAHAGVLVELHALQSSRARLAGETDTWKAKGREIHMDLLLLQVNAHHHRPHPPPPTSHWTSAYELYEKHEIQTQTLIH